MILQAANGQRCRGILGYNPRKVRRLMAYVHCLQRTRELRSDLEFMDSRGRPGVYKGMWSMPVMH